MSDVLLSDAAFVCLNWNEHILKKHTRGAAGSQGYLSRVWRMVESAAFHFRSTFLQRADCLNPPQWVAPLLVFIFCLLRDYENTKFMKKNKQVVQVQKHRLYLFIMILFIFSQSPDLNSIENLKRSLYVVWLNAFTAFGHF